jgi:hypothetical protein
VAIALAVGSITWFAASPKAGAARAVKLAMLVVIITGLVGVVFHYRANMEFQLESDPSLNGLALMKKALQAKSPPALAPANMALLGLIGLVGVSRDTSGG